MLPIITGPVCASCGAPLPDGGEHCFACRQGKRYHFVFTRSAGEYAGLLRTLLREFKFRNKDYLERFLGRLLVYAAEKYAIAGTVECIVPVPMHPLKRFFRGYNQAELLARRLSENLKVPVIGALRRVRLTRQQYLLRKRERSENVKGAFAAHDGASVKGKTVLLVDDICTTCATIEECSRVLRGAGAAAVYALTVARD
jgi:ComF family protein